MARVAGIALAALLAAVAVVAQSARTTLDIYLIDVEGGNATLFVSPAGESLLIDTGNGGPGAARDADRIVAAARDAGVTRIDHLITTHYHGDHFGAMARRARAGCRSATSSTTAPTSSPMPPPMRSCRRPTPSCTPRAGTRWWRLATACRWRGSTCASSRRRGRP